MHLSNERKGDRASGKSVVCYSNRNPVIRYLLNIAATSFGSDQTSVCFKNFIKRCLRALDAA